MRVTGTGKDHGCTKPAHVAKFILKGGGQERSRNEEVSCPQAERVECALVTENSVFAPF